MKRLSKHKTRGAQCVIGCLLLSLAAPSARATDEGSTNASGAYNVASISAASTTDFRQEPNGASKMTDTEIQTFVDKFAAAWAGRDSAAFLALWNPEGQLHYPFANRVIRGDEIGMLNELTKANAPDLTWRMIDWASRGDVIVVEWESSNRYGERLVTWRGMDKLTLREGRIVEEIVYADTAPLQAMRQGARFSALIQLPD